MSANEKRGSLSKSLNDSDSSVIVHLTDNDDYVAAPLTDSGESALPPSTDKNIPESCLPETSWQWCTAIILGLLVFLLGFGIPAGLCAHRPFAELIYHHHFPQPCTTELSTTTAPGHLVNLTQASNNWVQVSNNTFFTHTHEIISMQSPEEQWKAVESAPQQKTTPFPLSNLITHTESSHSTGVVKSFDGQYRSEILPLYYQPAVVNIVDTLHRDAHALQTFDDVYRASDEEFLKNSIMTWSQGRSIDGSDVCNQVFPTEMSTNATDTFFDEADEGLSCEEKLLEEYNKKIERFRQKDVETSASREIIDFDNLATTDSNTNAFNELKDLIFNIEKCSIFTYSSQKVEVRACSQGTYSAFTAKEQSASIQDIVSQFSPLKIDSIKTIVIEEFHISGVEYQLLQSLLINDLPHVKHVVFKYNTFALEGFTNFDWENMPSDMEFLFEGGKMHPLVRHMWKLYKPESRIMVFEGITTINKLP